jgi:hypothetical protein
MNTAVENAALMDQFIELTKRMTQAWIVLNVKLLWQEFIQLPVSHLRVMDGLVKLNERSRLRSNMD